MKSGFLNLTDQEKMLEARLEELFDLSREKGIVRFSPFLDERQQEIAGIAARKTGQDRFLLFGGYDGAQRCMLGAFPDYLEPLEGLFPIVPVTISFRRQDSLSHRDFLGALMGMLIKRESIGDILVGEGEAVVFSAKAVAALVCSELKKVGRVGVRCREGMPETLPAETRFETIEGVVSSMRADCVVAFLTKLSRSGTEKLIKSSLVSKNYETLISGSGELEEGDKLAIRGHGKFQIGQVGAKTRKDRLHITVKKYC